MATRLTCNLHGAPRDGSASASVPTALRGATEEGATLGHRRQAARSTLTRVVSTSPRC